MATEKIEPKTPLIMRVVLLAVVTLILVHAALVSYFDHMATAEEHRKYGMKPEVLLAERAKDHQRLTSGPMPIEKAMQEISAMGRMNASPAIAPSGSKDVGPLQGWKELPNAVPSAMMASPEPAASAAADAGPSGGAVVPKTNPGAAKQVERPAPPKHP